MCKIIDRMQFLGKQHASLSIPNNIGSEIEELAKSKEEADKANSANNSLNCMPDLQIVKKEQVKEMLAVFNERFTQILCQGKSSMQSIMHSCAIAVSTAESMLGVEGWLKTLVD